MIDNKILQSMLDFDKATGRKTVQPLASSPWIRSLDEKSRNTLMYIKRMYPSAISIYDLTKAIAIADDIVSMELLKPMNPPISWDRMSRHVTSSSMCKAIGCTYVNEASLVPVDESFISLVRAGRIDLVDEHEDADKYEEPGISTSLLKEFIPVDALEWLIANEHWDGSALARAVTMDRPEELGNDTLDEEAMEVILYYDAYSVYKHYKASIIKHPHLVEKARGRVRQDMLSMYPIIMHAIDDPHLTVDDIDTMMGAAIGTNLQDDVWNRADELHMIEIIDKYSDMVK